jgi:hypothetical protein
LLLKATEWRKLHCVPQRCTQLMFVWQHFIRWVSVGNGAVIIWSIHWMSLMSECRWRKTPAGLAFYCSWSSGHDCWLVWTCYEGNFCINLFNFHNFFSVTRQYKGAISLLPVSSATAQISCSTCVCRQKQSLTMFLQYRTSQCHSAWSSVWNVFVREIMLNSANVLGIDQRQN